MGTAALLAACGGGSSGGGGTGLPVNQLPKAKFQPNAVVALTGDTYQFDPKTSSDPDGALVKYEWDFRYDGHTFKPSAFFPTPDVATTQYISPGTYTVALQVTDDLGATDLTTLQVYVADHSKTQQAIPSTVDFGSPEVGQVVAGSVYVYNGGTATIHITGVTSDRSEVTPGALPASLAVLPQEAVPVPVNFKSFTTDTVVGTLSIEIDLATTLSVTFGGTAHSGFALVGSMIQARRYHTATRLQDGRVLIVGGEDAANQVLATAEIYDPDTHAFSAAPPMPAVTFPSEPAPRSHHTATLMADGTVLVAGGVYEDVNRKVHRTGVVFDPTLDQWTYAFALSTPRFQHVAVRVVTSGNERVVLIGGKAADSDPTGLASVEILGPNGSLVDTGTLNQPRVQHAAVAVDDHRILIAGGVGGVGGATAGAEVFNILDKTSVPLSLDVARYDLTLTAVAPASGPAHWLAVGGGQAGVNALASVEEFQDVPGGDFAQVAAQLAQPRYRHAAVDLGSGRGLLVLGGLDTSYNATNVAEIVQPGGGAATTLPDRMNVARGGGLRATRLDDGGVLITGGTGSGSVLKSAELYVPEP